MKFFLALFLCMPVFAATDIDENLQLYIKEFNLTSVRPPGEMNKQLFHLGRLLFHEKGLSGNDNIRCLDCHHPRLLTHDNIPLALGEGASGFQFGNQIRRQGSGRVIPRNSTALFNLHNVDVMFWDGRVSYNPERRLFMTPVPLRSDIRAVLKSALAAQAIFPMVDHDEMRGQKGSNPIADAKDEHEAWDLIVQKIMSIPEYKKLFEEVFPGEKINIGHFGEALAHFQAQNFALSDTPFDRYLKGNKEALTTKQKLGMDVFFNKGKCGECHHGEHLSSFGFQNAGSPQIGPGKENGDDFGRYQWNKNDSLKYAFRVAPLRNVGVTAPYFHNGAFKTLEEVVDHYADIKGSLENYKFDQMENYNLKVKDHDHLTNDKRLSHISTKLPLLIQFSKEEKEALVDFLRYGLTDMRLHGSVE